MKRREPSRGIHHERKEGATPGAKALICKSLVFADEGNSVPKKKTMPRQLPGQ